MKTTAEKSFPFPARPESAASFSPASLACERVLLGKKIECSTTVGWTSLLVQTFEFPASAERFETLPSPDQSIVLITKGEYEIESCANGTWKKAFYRRGFGGLTAAGKTDRLRWHSKTLDWHEKLKIYIPQFFFAAAAEEYARAGTAFRRQSPDALCFNDPVVFQIALALKEAMRVGAPNLYAETVAQFLATHLSSTHAKCYESSTGARNAGAISDRRLKRVLEFMEHSYAENLSLAELAREAGVSRFHFITLFKQVVGATPYQHLIRLRLNHAAALLAATDYSVEEIACRCGHQSTTHFAAMFRKRFAQSPAEYRRKNLKV